MGSHNVAMHQHISRTIGIWMSQFADRLISIKQNRFLVKVVTGLAYAKQAIAFLRAKSMFLIGPICNRGWLIKFLLAMSACERRTLSLPKTPALMRTEIMLCNVGGPAVERFATMCTFNGSHSAPFVSGSTLYRLSPIMSSC